MGGDSFEGVEKLINVEYKQITSQLIERLKPFCQRIEPYIPLPEKQVHGDVDFLVILKEQYKPKDVVDELKMEKYKINNNDTINSVYKNKQVDFCFVGTNKQFELASFYKSYSGVGAFLGLFLPTKQIKVTTKGVFALGLHKHIKLEYNVCDEVSEILKFYGLDSKRYHEGFQTRKELFEFLRDVRFLDEEKFAYYQNKNSTKLIKGMEDYLKNEGINKNKHTLVFQNALEQTLNYFNKKDGYQKAFKDLIFAYERTQNLNKKFNATHLFAAYEVSPKNVNEIKRKFHTEMFDNDTEKYYDWIEAHELKEILKEFEQRCGLKPKENKEKIEQKLL